jgi:hypothetical protein
VAQRRWRARAPPPRGLRPQQPQRHGGDDAADEREDELGSGARGAQRAGRQAARHHAGREGAVCQAHHRTPGCGLAAHALGVDGHVDRARGRAEHEQRRTQRERRGGQPGQRRRGRERDERRRQRRRAPAIDRGARQAHREQRAGADAQQRHPELAVVDPRVRLHRRQRSAPRAPEGTEGGEAAQDTHAPGHDRPGYPRRHRATQRRDAGGRYHLS